MNKRILYAASLLAAATLLGSCTKETIVTKTDPAKVPVKIVVPGANTQTRGTEATTSSVSGTFKLYAYEAVTPAVGHSTLGGGAQATLTGSGNSREATIGTHYWPVSNGLNFYAVYPETTTGLTYSSAVESNASYLSITYTVPTAMDEQQDILFAYNTGTTKGDPVPIHFQHALTRVTFQGQISNNAPDLKNVEITGITIKNANNTGTFKFNSYAPISGEITTLTGPGWNTSGSASFTADGLNTNNIINTSAPTAGSYIGYPNSNDSFFMMPMSSLTGIKLDVTVDWDGGSKTYPDIALPTTVAAWKRGEHVNYVLQLDADKEGTRVTVVKVTVQPWGDATSGGTIIINP